MKGILLAGGSGSRLYPSTLGMSKQLLPVYDKPMVYYPLTTLMLAGIKEILVITTPEDRPLFERVLKNAKQWGISLEFATQSKPRGLAEALIIGKQFIGKEPVCLILGDNLFYGYSLGQILERSADLKEGARIFGYYVRDPENYGVVTFDEHGKVRTIDEKPKNPLSNFAVPGIYFYDNEAPEIAASIKPSARGELEITDVNAEYLRRGQLQVSLLGRGIAWLDTGTHDSLLQASNFIQAIESRQGLKIGSPEEVAFRRGYISATQLAALAEPLKKTGYGKYLMELLPVDVKSLQYHELPTQLF